MGVSAGALIWMSLRPVIRLVLTASFGFALTKADVFPAVAARGAGQIVLNITLPCLMFSKMVPAFTSQNISALGPLCTVAIIYEILGFFIAWIIKQFFWVPHRFRYGILSAGIFGNVGDIPTSVVMSITASSPFNGSTDPALSVAYVAAFTLVFMISLFPLGGHKLVAKDFEGHDIEDADVREAVRKNREYILYGWMGNLHLRRRRKAVDKEKNDSAADGTLAREKFPSESNEAEQSVQDDQDEITGATVTAACTSPHTGKHVMFDDYATTTALPTPICSPPPTELPSRVCSPTPSITAFESTTPAYSRPASQHRASTSSVALAESAKKSPLPPPATYVGLSPTASSTPPRSIYQKVWQKIMALVRPILTPASITIILSIPIALITPLKGLFTPVAGSGIPNAPDGDPPLAFIMDTADFVGAASVPIGLMCLGSALARLHVPREDIPHLPWGSILSLAVGKLIVSPILGVLIVSGLVSCNFISKDDKVLQFVCIFLSCLPTATTQVYLTQVYSGTGSADHLSAYLIPQYMLMVVCMVAVIAYSLLTLF
ncbi:auxin efflux carrier [Fistulina hepatica ATCC 64428]|nr:auxin efflux carrier [Fistulina hepatica ATCC 64428]